MFTNKRMKELSVKNAILIITYAVALIAAFLHLDQILQMTFKILDLLRPFIYGFALAYIFNIPMKFFLHKLPLEVKKCRKLISAFLSLLVIICIFGFIFYIVVPQLVSSIQTFVEAFPQYITQTQELAIKYIDEYALNEQLMEQITLYSSEIQKYASELLKNLLPALIDTTMGITSSIANVFLALVIAVYMIVSKQTLVGQVKRFGYAFLPETKFDYIKHICEIANKTFSNFISGQMIEAVIIGVLCYIGCLILRIPYAPIVSVVIGCTNIIPIFGPIIGTAICGTLILFVSPIQAIIFVIFGICLQQFESNLIYPKVVGTSVGLSGLWVLFAITIGGGLFGLVGMVLGLPTFAIVYFLMKEEMAKRIQTKEELKTLELAQESDTEIASY